MTCYRWSLDWYKNAWVRATLSLALLLEICSFLCFIYKVNNPFNYSHIQMFCKAKLKLKWCVLAQMNKKKKKINPSYSSKFYQIASLAMFPANNPCLPCGILFLTARTFCKSTSLILFVHRFASSLNIAPTITFMSTWAFKRSVFQAELLYMLLHLL